MTPFFLSYLTTLSPLPSLLLRGTSRRIGEVFEFVEHWSSGGLACQELEERPSPSNEELPSHFFHEPSSHYTTLHPLPLRHLTAFLNPFGRGERTSSRSYDDWAEPPSTTRTTACLPSASLPSPTLTVVRMYLSTTSCSESGELEGK